MIDQGDDDAGAHTEGGANVEEKLNQILAELAQLRQDRDQDAQRIAQLERNLAAMKHEHPVWWENVLETINKRALEIGIGVLVAAMVPGVVPLTVAVHLGIAAAGVSAAIQVFGVLRAWFNRNPPPPGALVPRRP
jgi:hypothetical protein